MRNVKIIVVDSGVSKNFKGEIQRSYCVRFDKGEYFVEEDCQEDAWGHGTAVTNIIFSVAPGLEIISFGICDGLEEVNEEGLVVALEYIFEFLEADIINISAGLTYIDDYKRLDDICKRLTKKGCLIFSAFDNDGAVSYPAAFPEVIGIDCSDHCGKDEIIYLKHSCVNCILPSHYFRTVWKNGERAILKGTSFSCAYMAGLYGKYLLEEKIENFEQFLALVVTKTIKCKESKNLSKPLFNVRKAIIFPINKETDVILRNVDKLGFSIVGVYDVRVSGRVGREYLGFAVKAYEEINWNDTFDTVILSCVQSLQKLTGKNYSEDLLKQSKLAGKNIYSFETAYEENQTVFYPRLDSTMIPYFKLNKLNKISVPVVGVFGTSSSQGKYSLQNAIVAKLREKEYEVGFLSTEPSGYLVNADFVFHFGYHSDTGLGLRDIISILNEYIFRMQVEGKDIVVTGCQSAITHYEATNLFNYCIEQYGFLLGAAPDYSILCVNPFDDIGYLERSIQLINSQGDGKVKALALFPRKIEETVTKIKYSARELSPSEVKHFKEQIGNRMKLPIYEIGCKNDINILCNDIEKFFTP